ncbi:MAG: hypothetical protein HQK50_06100 [Oligoflexia bacterium]|nr:hypothetical protein [Oligoflexia bacterium]MBF0365123.1 hypothetical protein [Oligoflexia bacterium]
MMINLPAFTLPWEFTTLLQSDMKNKESSEYLLDRYQHLFSSGATSMVIERAFRSTWPKQEMKHIIKFLGPKNFRDRLASIYLYYFKHNIYPLETTPEAVSDVVAMEAQLEKYTTQTQSRLFLFFFYLKLTGIVSNQVPAASPLQHFPQEIISLLQATSFKIWYIDWLLLLLWHFHDFLGGDALKDCIKSKVNNRAAIKSATTHFSSNMLPLPTQTPYWSLFSKLSEVQKEQLIENFLTYGLATNNRQIFFNVIM